MPGGPIWTEPEEADLRSTVEAAPSLAEAFRDHALRYKRTPVAVKLRWKRLSEKLRTRRREPDVAEGGAALPKPREKGEGPRFSNAWTGFRHPPAASVAR
jgi:hypothetical protein